MAGLLGEGFSAVPTTDEPSRWGPAFSQPRSLRRSPVLPCILTSLVRRYTIGENSPTDSATEPKKTNWTLMVLLVSLIGGSQFLPGGDKDTNLSLGYFEAGGGRGAW